MWDRLRKFQEHALFHQLRDVRSLGLIGFGIVVILVSWSGVKTIQANYKLEQQISKLRQQNTVQKLQNENQKLRNEYYKTPQYLELAARQNFGLALPGEKELLVPKDVAMSYVSGVQSADKTAAAEKSESDKRLPFYQRNLQAWVNFFLHRSSDS
jgi:cell division protein FtsB